MFGKLGKVLLIALALLAMAGSAGACVGRILYVGALDTTEGKVVAELLAVLINERTGTTVKTKFYPDLHKLYEALKVSEEEKRVDIFVEETGGALARLGATPTANPTDDYAAAKERYDKELDLIWLNPFGFTTGQGTATPTISAPLIRRDVLTNFPLLPRVLNKLAGAIDEQAYRDLITEAKGEKPHNVAKEFLRARKLI